MENKENVENNEKKENEKKDGHYEDWLHGIDAEIDEYVANGIGAAFAENSVKIDEMCKEYRHATDSPMIRILSAFLYNVTVHTLNAVINKGVPLMADMVGYVVMNVHDKLLFDAWRQADKGKKASEKVKE